MKKQSKKLYYSFNTSVSVLQFQEQEKDKKNVRRLIIKSQKIKCAC